MPASSLVPPNLLYINYLCCFLIVVGRLQWIRGWYKGQKVLYKRVSWYLGITRSWLSIWDCIHNWHKRVITPAISDFALIANCALGSRLTQLSCKRLLWHDIPIMNGLHIHSSDFSLYFFFTSCLSYKGMDSVAVKPLRGVV